MPHPLSCVLAPVVALALATPALATDPTDEAGSRPATSPTSPDPTADTDAPRGDAPTRSPDAPETDPEAFVPRPQVTALEAPPESATSPMSNRGRVEVVFTSEYSAFLSDSVGATSTSDGTATPQLRLGYGLTDALVLSLGWRSLEAMSRWDRGFGLETSGDALLITARYDLPLNDFLALSAEVDLELLNVDYALDVGGLNGETSTLGFGAMPKVGLLARLAAGPVNLDLRTFVGFAVRTSHHPDDLEVDTGGDRIRPLDLGTLDLSAFIAGLSAAIAF